MILYKCVITKIYKSLYPISGQGQGQGQGRPRRRQQQQQKSAGKLSSNIMTKLSRSAATNTIKNTIISIRNWNWLQLDHYQPEYNNAIQLVQSITNERDIEIREQLIKKIRCNYNSFFTKIQTNLSSWQSSKEIQNMVDQNNTVYNTYIQFMVQ